MLGLDKRSSIPLYAQLKTWLLERIQNGEYEAGTKIPTELALCELLDLSRPTVRQAVSELVAEGTLYIVKGKGTFVSEKIEKINLNNFSPFSTSLFNTEKIGDIFIVDYQQIYNLNKELSIIFEGMPEIKDGIFEVVWTQSIDNKEFVYNTSYIPCVFFPDTLKRLRLRQDLLNETEKILLDKTAELKISVRPAQSTEARYLDIAKGALILQTQSINKKDNGKVYEYVVSAFRSDFVSLSQTFNE